MGFIILWIQLRLYTTRHLWRLMNQQTTQTTMVIFAILAAFGLVAIIAVDIALTTQEAEAKCQVFGTGYNASKGKCNPG